MHLKHTEEKYFHEFKKLIDKYGKELTKGEQYNLFTSLQGYCQAKVMGGNNKFGPLFFEACKNMISEGAYSGEYDDVIHPLTYKNIAKSGSIQGQFEWTLNFINTYREKLKDEFQDNVYYFCLAYCHFKMKDYDNSLKYLSRAKYENVYDKAEVNRLMMQLYYEMGLTEELLSLADTYKHFLHNDKLISENQKPLISNFVNLLLNLYKIKTQKSSSDYDILQIKRELTNIKTYEKIWLQAKLEELKK
jgi:tetratricopeptide (TPR) repeat protein